LNNDLDHHLIHEHPAPIFVGELPRTYAQVPAPVVVNLCGVYPPVKPPVRTILSLPFADVPDASYMPTRNHIERFLTAVHVHAASGPTYWHCHAGINRSSFVVAAYLHLYRGMRISDAIDTLRERRSRMALCNNVFERSLREWYGGPDEQEFKQFSMEDYLAEMRRHRDLARTREEEIADKE
jgi:hypothetical protein